tara:strand:+ start:2424 stop:3035 length:612 start_codon:yes stop_codon:yes gene_type:complete
MSNQQTDHYAETIKETREEQAELIAAFIDREFARAEPSEFATIRNYSPEGKYPQLGCNLDPAVQEWLATYQAKITSRVTESIRLSPVPSSDQDIDQIRFYILDFCSTIKTALSPLDTSDWAELGRAAHDIFTDLEPWFDGSHVELEGLSEAEQEQLLLARFSDAYETFLVDCDTFTTLTLTQKAFDDAAARLTRNVDMIYFLK